MTTALFAGSFDPFTIGHADIVTRGLRLFDSVVIAIGVNDKKQPLYTSEERLRQISSFYAEEKRIKVIAYTGLTADIAKAYPEEAAVDSWIRAYQLQKNRLIITDDYRLKMKKAPNQLNFMTWGTLDISEKGRIKLNAKNVKATLSYDANVFKPTIETVELTDQRLSKVWGDRIYRITLTANDQALSGQYRCTVTRDNP